MRDNLLNLFYSLLTEQYTVCLDQPEVVVKGLITTTTERNIRPRVWVVGNCRT